MKVRELIDILMGFDLDMDVVIPSCDEGYFDIDPGDIEEYDIVLNSNEHKAHSWLPIPMGIHGDPDGNNPTVRVLKLG